MVQFNGCKNLDDWARSGWSKTLDFEFSLHVTLSSILISTVILEGFMFQFVSMFDNAFLWVSLFNGISTFIVYLIPKAS